MNELGIQDFIPLLVFAGIVATVWVFLTKVSDRNSKAQERLDRMNRAALQPEVGEAKHHGGEKLHGILDKAMALSKPLMPKTELEQSKLKVKLANAGFRSEKASSIYLGLRFFSLMTMILLATGLFILPLGLKAVKQPNTLMGIALVVGIGLYGPEILLWYMRRKRQQQIFLTLPDALDLMVVCVESGLGLDAAMRKVTEEMKAHAPIICQELNIANFQLQMGRPRREVLHDLGVRTGVDDVRSLAAILIQADRFGSSVAQALRVQSDSMRIRRRQLAEEKAAKTAVQLIFPLVLFIFPGIFVVLVGPAAIQIAETMMKK